MLAPTNNSSKKTAPPLHGILKRKRLSAPPIPIIIFFFLFSFPALAGCLLAFLFLFSCQRSTEPLSNNNGLDTTSHNFTWEIDSIGVVGSYFNDIAIINEIDIFAVGHLLFEDTDSLDSLGNEIKPYNGARWNGENWSYLRTYPSYDTYHVNISIFPFSSNDIWVSFTAPYHWNGTRWTAYSTDGIHGAYTYGIWGNSSADLIIVGTDGKITHFNGSQWKAMDSGTDIKLRDIYGVGEHVFVVGYNDDGRSVVLELQDGQWQIIFSSESYYGDLSQNDYGLTSAVTVLGDIAYIVCKTGIIKYNYKSKNIQLIKASDAMLTGHDIVRIGANAENDIILVSLGGFILHFNGLSWRKFSQIPDIYGRGNIQLYSGYFKDNMVVACGQYDGFAQAIVVRGYRNSK